MESKKLISVLDEDEAPGNLLARLEEHLKKINGKIQLVIDYGAQSSESRGDPEATYILQRFSKVWGEFIDVIHLIEIDNGDHLKAVPLPRSVLRKEAENVSTLNLIHSKA